MTDIQHVLAIQAELGEGPLWDHRQSALYFVDILQNHVHRYHPATGAHQVFEHDRPVTVLGLRQAGAFVAAHRDGFAFWDDGTLQEIIPIEADRPESRFNDGAVDPQGRFWAGTMIENESRSALYRLDRDLQVTQMISGVTIANGLDWSPDGRTLYFTDTQTYKIFAYPFDPETGDIGQPTVFADCSDETGGGVPDGMTVDSEGFVWSARWGGWKLVRYDPQGKIEREIKLPVEFPTSCAFGGDDLTTLYITSARIAIPASARGDHPQAGDLFALDAGIAGLPAPLFVG